MMPEEAQAQPGKEEITVRERPGGFDLLYLLFSLNKQDFLGFINKDDFSRFIDAVAPGAPLNREGRYNRPCTDENGLEGKARYLWAKARLEELEDEKAGLCQIINAYKPV